MELLYRLSACSPRCAAGYRCHPAAVELMIINRRFSAFAGLVTSKVLNLLIGDNTSKGRKKERMRTICMKTILCCSGVFQRKHPTLYNTIAPEQGHMLPHNSYAVKTLLRQGLLIADRITEDVIKVANR